MSLCRDLQNILQKMSKGIRYVGNSSEISGRSLSLESLIMPIAQNATARCSVAASSQTALRLRTHSTKTHDLSGEKMVPYRRPWTQGLREKGSESRFSFLFMILPLHRIDSINNEVAHRSSTSRFESEK